MHSGRRTLRVEAVTWLRKAVSVVRVSRGFTRVFSNGKQRILTCQALKTMVRLLFGAQMKPKKAMAPNYLLRQIHTESIEKTKKLLMKKKKRENKKVHNTPLEEKRDWAWAVSFDT